jgi:hypothetical protein
MAKTIISLKNIAVPSKIVVIRDLNNAAVNPSSTLEISDTNSYSNIK